MRRLGPSWPRHAYGFDVRLDCGRRARSGFRLDQDIISGCGRRYEMKAPRGSGERTLAACWFCHSAETNFRFARFFFESIPNQKFAIAKCHRQHAANVRSPAGALSCWRKCNAIPSSISRPLSKAATPRRHFGTRSISRSMRKAGATIGIGWRNITTWPVSRALRLR